MVQFAAPMRKFDSHALVLDPFVGSVAYVPDLGKDLVREILYDAEEGALKMELNVLPSGLCTGLPDGPRYFEFHPSFETAYVVNELSSTVSSQTPLKKCVVCYHLEYRLSLDLIVLRFNGFRAYDISYSLLYSPSTRQGCKRLDKPCKRRNRWIASRTHQR